MIYTAWDLAPFAADLWQEANEPLRQTLQAQWQANAAATGGHPWDGQPQSPVSKPPFPPFKWSDERRAHIRAELDAYYARLYGLTRDELRYILDPEDVYGPDFPGETFRVLKEKEIKEHGEYCTQRLVLAAWDQQQRQIDSGKLRFDAPAAPPRNNAQPPTTPTTTRAATPKPAHTPPPARPPHKTTPATSPLPNVTLPDISEQLAAPFHKRLAYVNKLSRQTLPFATAELVAYLNDPEHTIRWMVRSVVANRGGPHAVAALAAYLQANPDGPGREEALGALRRIAENNESEEHIRLAAAKVLENASGP